MTISLDIGLLQSQFLTSGNLDLPLDQVKPCNEFRDWMLDLDPSIDFDEEEFLSLGVVEKLAGAGVVIIHGLGEPHSGFANLGPDIFRHNRTWRFFNQFLVASLNRTVPFPTVNHMAVLICQQLDFNVARIVEIPLHVNTCVPERGFSLGSGRAVSVQETVFITNHPHALATTTSGGFDQDRETNFLGNYQGVGFGINGPV